MKKKDRLLNVFENIFDVGSDIELNNLSIDSLQNWDSLNHLNLIIAIENEFKININPEDFPHLYSDFRTILNFIDSK